MKKILAIALVVLSVFLIGSCSQPVASIITEADAAKAAPAGFKVVGYMPSWSGTAQEIEYDKLTNIIYAFAIPDTNGNIIDLENPQKLQDIVSLAHAQGVKVSLACGGWSYKGAPLDPTFETLGANPVARQNLIDNLMALVAQYNLDGIDMDWEYPDAGTASEANYEALMLDLSAALKAQGKILSAAVSASTWAGSAIRDSVFNAMDLVNVMAYDGDGGAGHSPMSYAESSLNYYLNTRNVPKEKVMLGVPFYSRPGWKAWSQIVAMGPAAVNVDTYNGEHYNGIPTMKAKTQLAMDRCGGVMIWELSHDTHDSTSLLRAINEQMGSITPATPTPVVTQGPTNTPTVTPTVDPNACVIADWVPGTYTNQEVCHKGRHWKAQWWTTAEPGTTGQWGAWKDLGPCPAVGGATPTPTATSTTVVVTPTATSTTVVVTPTATSTTVVVTPTATPTQGTGPVAWAPNTSYAAGDLVTYNGIVYACRQPHTSLVGWEPPNVASLWLAQ